MEGHVAMEWKDPYPGPESLMGFQTRADAVAEHSNDNVKAGFEEHGLSVAMSSTEESRPLPVTPQFAQKTSPGGSLAERMQARAGFKVPKLKMPFSKEAGEADNSLPGAPSPYLTIPPGLSPATLLESPLFISNAMVQPSPTTGKLFLFGSTNDNDPIRFGDSPVEDTSNAFSFKPLDLKSSRFTGEAMKEQSNPVKTEPRTEPVQEAANLLGQLNHQDHSHSHNVQTTTNPNTGGGGGGGPPLLLLDSNNNLSRLASGSTDDERVAAAAVAAAVAARPDYVSTPQGGATVECIQLRDDGYSWRKYGQKQVKHSEYPRSYFKCTHPSCAVKKKVERSQEGHVTEIIYKGSHSHPRPSAAASMQEKQVAEYAHRLGGGGGSPSEGGGGAAEVTSSVSDEVDGGGGDRVMMSHGGGAAGADAEGDELDSSSKRRKLELEAYAIERLSRAVREPRVVIQTKSEVDILDDGYRWRKYGQKVVKGNPNPRSYYKCTQRGCPVRKHVERASHDLKSVITTYEGKHDHEVPTTRNSGGGGGGHHQATAAAAAATACRPEHHHLLNNPSPPSAHDGGGGLMMMGVPFGGGLPMRDPLAPMANFPTYAALGGVGPGPTMPLPSLPPMPAEALKIPMLAPTLYQLSLLRHRQAMQAAGGFPADVKIEGGGGGGGAPPPAVYQQVARGGGLRLGGHQM